VRLFTGRLTILTTTNVSSSKIRMETLWYWLTQIHLEKWPLTRRESQVHTHLTTLKSRLTWVSQHLKRIISYSALGISPSLLLSLQFPLIIFLLHPWHHSVLRANHPFLRNFFACFPGPTYWSGSLNLQSNIFSSNHHPFLKHVHISTIYFFGPLSTFIVFYCVNSKQ